MSKAVDKFISNDWDIFENKIYDIEECSHTLDGSKAIYNTPQKPNHGIR